MLRALCTELRHNLVAVSCSEEVSPLTVCGSRKNSLSIRFEIGRMTYPVELMGGPHQVSALVSLAVSSAVSTVVLI